ncbi:MAG: hypothetical protein JNJ47_07280 [Alphaproteobacteria bacterium]|nr:hypothetical protein [Alphaproteobacteria bacterium]
MTQLIEHSRLKKNAAYTVIESCKIAEEDNGFIFKNQVITLSNRHPRSKKVNYLSGVCLRLVHIQHPSCKESSFMILTNSLEASLQCITDWYKERWSTELLFKWLK